MTYFIWRGAILDYYILIVFVFSLRGVGGLFTFHGLGLWD